MPNERTTLADLHMEPSQAFAWPVTCRFTTLSPWGYSQQEITLNIPGCAGDEEKSQKVGQLLWSVAIAPAISFLTVLKYVDVICWNGTQFPAFIDGKGARGQSFYLPEGRDNSGQVVLCTGDGDKRYRRRILMPGMPSGWSSGGLLTTAGWEGMLAHWRAAYMGLQPLEPVALTDWLVAYPHIVQPNLSSFYGVGFRRVTSLRVCHHVDRAPDLSGAFWP